MYSHQISLWTANQSVSDICYHCVGGGAESKEAVQRAF